MLEDVDGITGMLDSLMLLSRADEGKVPLSREAVNVHELIFSLCEDMNVLSDPKGQTLTIHGDDGLVAQLDARVLRLALINLVDNAIKFAPRGSEIEITTRLAIDELQIEVHNPGEGIAAEHRDAIFDRFYRVDLGRSRSAGGSGLGLSVARWAVEAHQGTISLVDGPNGVTAGATFRIALPFGPLKTA
jgi:signal transduction histidine kinase